MGSAAPVVEIFKLYDYHKCSAWIFYPPPRFSRFFLYGAHIFAFFLCSAYIPQKMLDIIYVLKEDISGILALNVMRVAWVWFNDY